MEKRIAIITGASGGLGKEFVRLMVREEVDEIWAIGRNHDKLIQLKNDLGEKIIPISKDLSKTEELRSIGELLENQTPRDAFLENTAGNARMPSYQELSVEEIDATLHINCSALAILCNICIPYMSKGSKILNISSASSFQPLPYINLYAATKAFERSYSRALNMELKGTGITATAVCPSWVDTDLLMKEKNGVKIKFPGIVSADRVAIAALRDAKRGKDMSICTWYVKYLHVLAKLTPHSMVMNTWVRDIRKYL
jgi:short-subunit dehydrogenase